MRRLLTILACVAMLVAAMAAPAAAAKPFTLVTGTFVLFGGWVECTPLGTTGDELCNGQQFGHYGAPEGTGDITGDWLSTWTYVTHPDGSYQGHGTTVCDCTIDGRIGSFEASFFVRGSGTAPYWVKETVTIIGASGGLEGLSGKGSSAGYGPSLFQTYAYKIRFTQ